jgi:hypothetical protein
MNWLNLRHRFILDLDSGEDPGWHYLQSRHKWGVNLLKETFDKFAERMTGEKKTTAITIYK